LALTVNGLVFDAAVWKAATGVTAGGRVAAGRVDAGLDWVGYYSPTAMRVTPDGSAEPGIYGMDAFFPNDHPCYVVAPSPQAVSGWTLVSERVYRPYGVFGTARLYVYRTGEATCR
jgi:hypothetical protein